MSKGLGKNQRAIMDYLNKNPGQNVSVRYLALQVFGQFPTKKQINTVRNSVKRLEKDNYIDTIRCSVFSKDEPKPHNHRFYPSQITMVRLTRPGLKYRSWKFGEFIYLPLSTWVNDIKV